MAANGPSGPAPARRIFVCGDSSGGGQALATVLGCRDGLGGGRDQGRPPTPALHGCCAICPLADLSYDVRRGGGMNSYHLRNRIIIIGTLA
jgi:acetyl esterase/lipase